MVGKNLEYLLDYLSIDFYGNSENLAILEKAKEEYERLVSFYEFFSDSDDDSFE